MSTNLSMFRVYLVLMLLCFSSSSMAIDLDDHPKVKAVAAKLVEGGHYNYDELEAIFAKAKVSQSVLDAMTSPAEYKFTWGKYRKLFLKEDRINQGADFWADNKAQLSLSLIHI